MEGRACFCDSATFLLECQTPVSRDFFNSTVASEHCLDRTSMLAHFSFHLFAS